MDESIDFDAEFAQQGSGSVGGIGGGGGGESIKVIVRVRPLSDQERIDGHGESSVDLLSPQQLSVTSSDHRKTFTCAYDAVLGPNASQAQVYDCVKECTTAVLGGINCTIFAYGQTGSGKTHSMYGPPNFTSPHNPGHVGRDIDQLGVIPRAIHHLFEQAKAPGILDFQVHCSFVQIYNENLYDMLRDSGMNQALTIREDQQKQIYVQGLSEYGVKTVSDTLMLLKIAEENRAIRETNMNLFSSRSHSIFQLMVSHRSVASDGGEVTYRAKFNLVDLAGSEKWDLVHSRTQSIKAEHITEMNNINLSLHTLGKCISALAKISRKRRHAQQDSSTSAGGLDSSMGSLDLSFNASNKPSTSKGGYHVPYRESKLTRLLQDSLGGNAKTFLIATVSPARSNAEETISTLKFADRAKQVMIQAKTNEIRPVDHALVQRLQAEVTLYRAVMQRMVHMPIGGGGSSSSAGGFVGDLLQAHTNKGSSWWNVSCNEGEKTLLLALLQTYLAVNPNASNLNLEIPTGPHVSHSNGGNSSPLRSPHPSSSSSTNQNNHQNTVPSTGSNNNTLNLNGEVVPGGGLEYIISLEKALNREQVHAQHLMQKNETLIKELEELKLQNLQYFQQQSTGNPSTSTISTSSSSLHIPEAELTQVIESIHALLHQNDQFYSYTDQLQKTMKKFFKYQIEEEEMKEQVQQVFQQLQQEKSKLVSQQVNDNFAFLQYLQQHANKGIPQHQQHVPPHQQPLSTNNTVPTGSSAGSNALRKSKDKSSSKSTHNNNAGSNVMMSGSQSLPQLAPIATTHPPSSSGNTNPSSSWQQPLGNISNMNMSVPQPLMSPMHQQHQPFQQMPQQGYPTMMQQNFPPAMQPQFYQQPIQQQLHMQPPMYQQQPQQMGYGFSPTPTPFQQQPLQPLHGYHTSQPTRGSSAEQPHITMRVRGADTEDSESTPVFHLNQDQETEEERIARELKKAKKKQKQKEKLQQWMQQKEERANTEKRLQEEEKKALMEAEALREQKRKEYVAKQKAKLQNYQDQVKGEAEKIQQLINLGIDPKSLNI